MAGNMIEILNHNCYKIYTVIIKCRRTDAPTHRCADAINFCKMSYKVFRKSLPMFHDMKCL